MPLIGFSSSAVSLVFSRRPSSVANSVAFQIFPKSSLESIFVQPLSWRAACSILGPLALVHGFAW
jgi:hypothetical protein